MKIEKIILVALTLIGASFAFTPSLQAKDEIGLFARPDIASRIVASVTEDAELEINGCLADKSWCDVSFGGHRGWVSGAFLAQSAANGQAYTVMSGPYVPAPVDNSIYHTEEK